MVQPNEVFPVLELSNDDRVRVFRKSIHGIQAFEGMEVDAYIIFTDRFLIMLDTMLCPEDVSATLQSVSTEIIGRSLLCINSHADWDHAWGNHVFAGPSELLPAPIIVVIEARTLLARMTGYGHRNCADASVWAWIARIA